jgi:hypothetical protein
MTTFDLARLAELRNPAGHAGDHGLLALHQRREVHAHVLGQDAVRSRLLVHERQQLRAVQQRLGRDAAHPQAGPAQGGVLVDQRHLEAQLRRAQGADVTAGPGADHTEVIGLVGHGDK